MERVRLALSEGDFSPSGNPQRKRKPTSSVQPSEQVPKRTKTNTAESVPLPRRSARLIAKQQRLEAAAVSLTISSGTTQSKQPTTTVKTSTVSRSRGSRRSSSNSSTSTRESVVKLLPTTVAHSGGSKPPAKGETRKRKRSSSPKPTRNSEPANTRPHKSDKCVPPTRRSKRASQNRTKNLPRLSQTTTEDRDTEVVTESELKTKLPSKRQRTTTSKNTTTSYRSVVTVEQLDASDLQESSGSSSSARLGHKRKEKGKRRNSSSVASVEESEHKRNTRQKERSKVDTGEGVFDRHGRRVTGKSVICEPSIKGKGKSSSVVKSVKGKGKAKTETPRCSFGATHISLPSFIDLDKLGMSDERSNKATSTAGEHGESEKGKATAQVIDRGKGEEGEGASSSDDPLTTMSEDNRRLQSMLEAQGLPPHLLGALGSKMQYILQKSFSSMSSSNSSRSHQLLSDMESGDESTQLQSCIEVGQLLVMGNEETLSGFPVKQAVPLLSNLLSLEHNFDMMVHACRALTYMMDALPRSSVVVAKTIPLLVEKLQSIQCMDVAEQALSALELLSRRHGKDILQAGGLNASLAYLDFFSLTTQRRALSVTANCCYSLTEDDFSLVVDSIPILTARLQHQDKKSVESCCQCFSRLVESFSTQQTLLRQIVTTALLQNLQQLLVVSPPVISSTTFVSVLRMLSTLCSSCPPLAVELLQINIADTLRYLLAGSGEITLDNIELMSRSPNEVYEILSLTSHLMPPLPKDGIFEVEAIISTKKHTPTVIQWEWQENDGGWRPYSSLDNRNLEMAHLTHEEECSVSIMGRDYTIDMGTMQQINEDTGTTRSVRRTVLDRTTKSSTAPDDELKTIDKDARAVALTSDPTLGCSFVEALFPVLYELFNSMAGSSVHNKCLKTILRILYHSNSDVLEDILRDIPVSSHIATMLKSKDYQTIVGGVQMAHILMEKLPNIFLISFHREGVVHEVKALRSSPLRLLATPRKEIQSPLSSSSTAPLKSPPMTSVAAATAQTTPPGSTHSSTRKRLSDIIRRGKRHFRRSLTRGRSEDDHPPPSIYPHPSLDHHPHHSHHSHHTTRVVTPPKAAPVRSSSFSLTVDHPLAGETQGGGDVTITTIAPPLPGHHEAARNTTREGDSEVLVGSSGSVKEKVNAWINCQLDSFIGKWIQPDQQHPALEAAKKLSTSVDKLILSASDYLEPLKIICSILVDYDISISSFEIIHSNLVPQLTSFLTVENPECVVPLNSRLRMFVHVFIGIPGQGTSLADWSPPSQLGLIPLLQKLHGCVSQLEQFAVRVNDMPGRRGSQALRFFNTHQIKCSLERHSTAPSSVSNWKGGPLRIDPLATLQTLERYLVVRGIGRSDQAAAKRLEDFEFGDEVDDTVIASHISSTDRHYLEFLINDQVLPYNMTVFQAIRQYAVSLGQESDEDVMPLGRPEIWIKTHSIHYRPIVSPSGGGGAIAGSSSSSKVLSTSLPSTPLQETAASPVPRKSSSSGSTRKRQSSLKQPLTVPTLLPRVTRSVSREKANSAALSSPPFLPTHSRHPPLPSSTTTTTTTTHPQPTKSFTPSRNMKPLDKVAAKKSPPVGLASKEKQKRYGGGLSPLHQALRQSIEFNLSIDDPSLPLLRLMKILYSLNSHWTDLYQGVAGNPVVPMTEFVSSKLSSKANRQIQDPLNVMTGSFPPWLRDLAKHCPFLFPFECRQMLFYITTFDRDRAIARLQEQRPELATESSSQTVSPKFSKKKRCVARESLLEQGEKIINELASNRAMLEIHYQDEVGTGLGPTLEFYTLLSREFQRADLSMWRGELCPPLPGASLGAALYVHSPVGLFPCPLGPTTNFTTVEEICSKFRYLGKFIAKAIMDSRMLDIPLSEAFYKWMLGQEGTFTAQDLQHVDPVVARSFAQLAAVAVNKHKLESDPLLSDKALSMGIDSLSLEGGGTIDDLDLDFTLPGYPDIELKPGGKDVTVNIHNLDEYLKLVVDWTLVRGVSRQIEAFKEGFSAVFPLSSLQPFYPIEMDMLLCGANHQKWDVKELMECCRPDHGYSHDSLAVQNLFEVLSTYDTIEQRQFIQFVTGSPRLPVGGFKALNPPLTIVRKTVESPQTADNFLPSVMTCVNYLKLPDYSTVEVMREKLGFALREGKDCFHLS